jgi:hypothetical protein
VVERADATRAAEDIHARPAMIRPLPGLIGRMSLNEANPTDNRAKSSTDEMLPCP